MDGLMRWGRHHRTLVAGLAALLITSVIGLSVGVVLVALEGHQLPLHVGVGAAGIHGGDPQRRLALAQ